MSGLVSWPVARAAFRERSRSFIVGALAVLLAAAAFTNGMQSGWGGQAFAGFARMFYVVLTMVLGAGLIADELETGHAQLVLLRPLTRASWFGGRLAGAALVLLAALAAAWIACGIGVVAQRRAPDLAWIVTLPAAFVEAFGWLALLAALSVVLSRWTNVGLLLLLAMAWWFLRLVVPFALGDVKHVQTMGAIQAYLGPQDASAIVAAVRTRSRPDLGPLLYDLAWASACWLAGVLLLNRAELARRGR